MKSVINAQSLKMAGGFIVIAGACFIMFPDLIGYLGSIGRLLAIVLVAILSAAFITRAFYKLKNPKTATAGNSKEPAAAAGTDTTSDT